MKKAIKELIENHYSEIDNKTEIKLVFEKALINFIEFHNFQKNGEYDTLFCNIHTNFKDGHNCVACNLNDSLWCSFATSTYFLSYNKTKRF